MKNRLLIVVLLFSFICVINITMSSCRQGGRWSKEWEERYESFQPSKVIMDSIGVRDGMVIGEVGAGNGRFAVRLAGRVGDTGKIYANDIDGKALDFMRKRIKKEDLSNMVVVEGKMSDPLFPKAELDMVCIINTYDEFSRPVEILKNIVPSLKSDGRLVILVLDPEKIKDHHGHAVAKEVVISQAKRAGYELEKLKTFLSRDNIYIFQVKKN